MEQLSYATLEIMDYQGYSLKTAPERILQFGEGNFLRGFADYFIDVLNERCDLNAKVVLVNPTHRGKAERFNAQEGLYTVYLRGMENGVAQSKRRMVSSVSRCLSPYADFEGFLQTAQNPDMAFVLSNTTEAGIVYDEVCQLTDAPATAFPAKVTQWLYARFTHFGGAADAGVVFLPCELIDANGEALKSCVLRYAKQWQLPQTFAQWIETANTFCSTLVDRIVTGYPSDEADQLDVENGYIDRLATVGEPFANWVIEGPQWVGEALKLEGSGLPILICDDQGPYKKRKVRILNGAHTSTALAAYLMGYDIVRDCMADQTISAFLTQALEQEIMPVIDLPKEDLAHFASAVKDRFQNPYIDHKLLDISLNSVSKWRARVLPTILEYHAQFGTLPERLVFSFAALLAFYTGKEISGNSLLGCRDGASYPIIDNMEVLQFFAQHSQDDGFIHAVASHEAFWGCDLTAIPDFEATVTAHWRTIATQGLAVAMKAVVAD
ncbi:tagaturonate reductase [Bengtsoniella intestinalis]|uniref:tagaturonate reductase n=1 Tax=Bengtsoniella intestinalis TaxID=3073143 RepID=UPI00391F66A6